MKDGELSGGATGSEKITGVCRGEKKVKRGGEREGEE